MSTLSISSGRVSILIVIALAIVLLVVRVTGLTVTLTARQQGVHICIVPVLIMSLNAIGIRVLDLVKQATVYSDDGTRPSITSRWAPASGFVI
jgi:hypothetical protein